MVEKRYEWAEGAKLEEHSRRKHKILREYVFDYLTVRCKLPQQERFRLAICLIPDDHIDPRRTALFVARSILGELRDGGRGC